MNHLACLCLLSVLCLGMITLCHLNCREQTHEQFKLKVFPTPTNVLSQSVLNYPAIRSQFIPRKQTEKTYSSFLPRLHSLLDEYSNQVVACHRQGRSSCLTFEENEGIFASSPYKEEELEPSFPKVYPTEIQSSICQSDPHILIGIPTSPSQYAERLAIRTTWCNTTRISSRSKLACIFFAAYDGVEEEHNRYLREEADQFGDIVQFRFQNGYLNLTQLQLSSYNWTIHHCPSIKYYIRSDSDMFVNPQFILNYLIPYPRSLFAYGVYIHKGRPIRYPTSKYYLPEWLYPQDFFYPYHSGCFYIWSRDILDIIVRESNHVRPIHYIDDVYYGQIFHARNITLKKAYNTIHWNQAPLSPSLWKKRAAAHRYSPVDLVAISKLMNTSA